MRKPFCPAGHDKRVVGITSHYQCKECERIKKRRQYEDAHRTKQLRADVERDIAEMRARVRAREAA